MIVASHIIKVNKLQPAAELLRIGRYVFSSAEDKSLLAGLSFDIRDEVVAVEATIHYFGRVMSTEEAKAAILREESGLGGPRELLTLGAVRPDLQLEKTENGPGPIIALGILVGPNEYAFIGPYINKDQDPAEKRSRVAGGRWADAQCSNACRFLGVRVVAQDGVPVVAAQPEAVEPGRA